MGGCNTISTIPTSHNSEGEKIKRKAGEENDPPTSRDEKVSFLEVEKSCL